MKFSIRSTRAFKTLALAGLVTCFGLTAEPTVGQQTEANASPIVVVNQDGESVKSVQITGQADAGARAVVGGAGQNGVSIQNDNGKITIIDNDGNTRRLDVQGARSFTVNQGTESVIVNGEETRKVFGKAIIIGPDGQRQEIELGDAAIGGMNIPGFRGAFRANRVGGKFMIGVNCQKVNELLSTQLNLDTGVGLAVRSINDGSPAAQAGIQKHDILMFADDKELSNLSDLTDAVEAAGKEKAKISVTVIRAGKEIGVEVTPVERPTDAAIGAAGQRIMLNVLPQIQGNFDIQMQQALPGLIFDANAPFLAPPHINQDMHNKMKEQMDQMREQMDQLQKDMEQQFNDRK